MQWSIAESASSIAFKLPVVARFLLKNNRKQVVWKKSRDTESARAAPYRLASTSSSLPEAGIVIFCLCHTRVKGRSYEGHWLDAVLGKQVELLGGI